MGVAGGLAVSGAAQQCTSPVPSWVWMGGRWDPFGVLRRGPVSGLVEVVVGEYGWRGIRRLVECVLALLSCRASWEGGVIK